MESMGMRRIVVAEGRKGMRLEGQFLSFRSATKRKRNGAKKIMGNSHP